jgi:hypothetical protein
VRLSPDFHSRWRAARSRRAGCRLDLRRENLRPACLLREMVASKCTKSGHPAVDGLHSVENKSDKGAHFLLTPELEGVQQDRSLTVS